jgi:hypothetical protein
LFRMVNCTMIFCFIYERLSCERLKIK